MERDGWKNFLQILTTISLQWSGQGKVVLQYASLAASTAAASVIVHPIALMATWQIVQVCC